MAAERDEASRKGRKVAPPSSCTDGGLCGDAGGDLSLSCFQEQSEVPRGGESEDASFRRLAINLITPAHARCVNVCGEC